MNDPGDPPSSVVLDHASVAESAAPLANTVTGPAPEPQDPAVSNDPGADRLATRPARTGSETEASASRADSVVRASLPEARTGSAQTPNAPETEASASRAESVVRGSIPEESEVSIRRMLSAYEIGLKLRQLRLRKKIALVDLGKHTGFSASMLSQLENGKLIPTLPTLARIAMVFDVGVDHFFTSKRGRFLFSVIRASERIQFPEKPEMEHPSYQFECLAYSVQDKSIQCYIAQFPYLGEDVPKMHSHESAEFVYLMEGKLEIRYHDEVYVLSAGDSAYFDGAEMHSYRGLSVTPSKALVVTSGLRA